ncbi:hypothetical protein [Micromonospora sp. NPDC050276]|uniref:hypothetical protein n=1 Tax=Micromonospora sp. NPDC050276 TaxID=3364278 RepID=UPI003794C36F
MRSPALLVLSAVTAAALLVVADGSAHAATLPTGAVSLEAVNQAGRYVRHIDYLGQLDPVTSSRSTGWSSTPVAPSAPSYRPRS